MNSLLSYITEKLILNKTVKTKQITYSEIINKIKDNFKNLSFSKYIMVNIVKDSKYNKKWIQISSGLTGENQKEEVLKNVKDTLKKINIKYNIEIHNVYNMLISIIFNDKIIDDTNYYE